MENFFSEDELKCKCCGENKFNQNTLELLNRLRISFGKPIIINSGYRCEEHNKAINATQTHASGQAVDIKCSHKDAFRIVKIALRLGFTGIGVSQKGNTKTRFIHLDDLESEYYRPRPHIWSY